MFSLKDRFVLIRLSYLPICIALLSVPFFGSCGPEEDSGSIIDVRGPGSPIPGKGSDVDNPPLSNADAGTEPTLPPIYTWDGGMVYMADSGEPESTLDRTVPMPNFSLVDKNPNSPDIGEYFGPRQFRGKISGWYFSHST